VKNKFPLVNQVLKIQLQQKDKTPEVFFIGRSLRVQDQQKNVEKVANRC